MLNVFEAAIVQDALREMLARQKQTLAGKPVSLTTVSGNGAQPGVNLDKSAALLSTIEATSDPD